MRLTPRQLQTTTPHPLVTMVRGMGPTTPKTPSVRPSIRPPSVRPFAVRPSVRPSAVRRPSVRPSYYYYPNGWMCVTLQTLKPRQIVTVSWNDDAYTILPQPLNP